jgi:hypothetical protein
MPAECLVSMRKIDQRHHLKMDAKIANVLREWVDLNEFLFALGNSNLFDLCFTDTTEAIGQSKGYKAGVSIWTTNCFKFYGA